jgi:hypothetical protein
MKMKIFTCVTTFCLLFTSIYSQIGKNELLLKCGRDNPQSYTDCSIADLSTGFLCCYVTGSGLAAPVCALMTYEAREAVRGYGLNDGITIYKNDTGFQTFQCGTNSSNYVKLSISLIFLILVSLLV